jgi:ribA/ribD-fused uncharacterized protein
MDQNSNLRPCPAKPAPMVQVSQLKALWAECGSSPPAESFPTVEFYGHRPASGALRCFSNFYEHPPFDFVVPPSCGAEALVAAGRPHRVPVTFTEKAIMLCKASIMGDYKTYDKILAAASPQEAKALGRAVSPFVPAIWDALVCEVARAVCVQKALGVPELHARLLETGERVIAEMTRNDCNWGTGLDIGHKDASMPSRWPGTNILGWALMQARAEMAAAAGSSGATSGGGRGGSNADPLDGGSNGARGGGRGCGGRLPRAATCSVAGCSRDAWNGHPGQQCCRSCHVSNGGKHGPDCDRKAGGGGGGASAGDRKRRSTASRVQSRHISSAAAERR